MVAGINQTNQTIMKKTIIAIMAAAAALSAVSCNKAEVASAPEAEKQAQTLNLDLNIPSLGSDADTKAMKTDWVAGDKLNIWFDDWNPGKDTPDPDLVITYDGTNWTAGELKMSAKSDGTARSLKEADGKMVVLYEGYNDFTGSYTHGYNSNSNYEKFTPKTVISWNSNGYAAAHKLIAFANKVSYTYEKSSNTLTASITGFTFRTALKVLVKTDDMSVIDNASSYVLTASYSSGTTTKSVGACYLLGAPTEYGVQQMNSPSYALGVKESDGIAFYFSGFNTSITETDITFSLSKIANAGVESTVSYTASNKTLKFDTTKCQGISIKYSKFSATASE